ncbi:uncharacterized protein LTR77_002470 [Saxophila tyrrhenica]|uniref:HTH CENPB-type domain-containing protein n=1 Tax=Saxophila tyrrhenica TaxID=1690608 RepID=A0AAV9PIQ4_9PEZI|nr:hypothetical protein LTR77_002470 [Saxophila tyrrhenica]
MATDDDRRPGYQTSPPTQWGPMPHIYPHSSHGTPVQEFTGFNFGHPQMPMEPAAFGGGIQQRPAVQQLQPLVMPQWPSMLNSQSPSNYQHVFPQPLQPIQPMSMGQSQTPVSASSARSATTPRKTLTDSDRKRMCQYAEDHPNSKQTEIGAIFGVERSTVSKVLRQKEKYLLKEEGSQSPAKRVKGRSPDIERTLANWAKNQERKGRKLTDDSIRDQARAFATTASPEHQQVLTTAWLEKFKLNHNIMGARSRKSSLAPDDAEGISSAVSSSHTPSGTSPISPEGVGSPELHSAQSQESLQNESPDALGVFGRRAPFHSQSTNSLNSAFTDTAPSSTFSPQLSDNTSPLFTPDSGTAPGPFGPLTARPILPLATASNTQRPRSQTMPVIYDPQSSDDLQTPKYIPSAAMLDSPMEEASDPIFSMDEAVHALPSTDRPQTVSPAETMRPPPLPAHVAQRGSPSASGAISPEQAQRSLEVVMQYIEQQDTGFLDFQQSIHVEKLMTKLKQQRSRSGS